VEAEVAGELPTVMKWADEFRALGVRTNADTPHDAATAVKFGAEGIGLHPHRAYVLQRRTVSPPCVR